MYRPLLSLTMMLALFFAGCGDRNEFMAYADVESSGWAYGDTLSFVTEIDDSHAAGTLDVNVRHNSDYLFQNLWLELTYNNSTSLCRDTVNIRLADKYGNWLGDGFGPRYQTSVRVADHVVMADSALVSVRHIMRVDTLRSVEQIGITFTPSSTK